MVINSIKLPLLITNALLLLSSCATINTEGTLTSLNDIKFEVKEEKIENSLEKAMASYAKFLKETPETEMTPEALRRLADLKIQKEYEVVDEARLQQETNFTQAVAGSALQATDMQAPDTGFVAVESNKNKQNITTKDGTIADISEDVKIFGERASKKIDLSQSNILQINKIVDNEAEIDSDDLQAAGAKEAIELYKRAVKKISIV